MTVSAFAALLAALATLLGGLAPQIPTAGSVAAPASAPAAARPTAAGIPAPPAEPPAPEPPAPEPIAPAAGAAGTPPEVTPTTRGPYRRPGITTSRVLDVPVRVEQGGATYVLPDSRGGTDPNVAAPRTLSARPLGPHQVVLATGPLTASGERSSYHIYPHVVSTDAEFRAAAASPRGCLLLGDSIAWMIRDRLLAELATKGMTCAYDTWGGRATEGAVLSLDHLRRTTGLPPTIIVVSGTNDLFHPEQFAARHADLMDRARGSRVVWVTNYARRVDLPEHAAADLANTATTSAVIADGPARHPGSAVVDWRSWLLALPLADRPGYVYDGIHPTAAGIEQLVGMIAGQV